ncbi:hypothetical protein [Gaoshiqia sp. Z1-71]|uniref:hypothetical protein n=1 Tax=Gaoshiqia hydrogeniformans TaxID=3290090 RepID=UPI003BF8A96E
MKMKKHLLTTTALMSLVLIILLIRMNNSDGVGEFHETTIESDHAKLDPGNLRQGKPNPAIPQTSGNMSLTVLSALMSLNHNLETVLILNLKNIIAQLTPRCL